ncbi:hypothetical protein [Idiomarina sp.]|uniref:hypothetical protein n=1 Tax=Idiomarina sp. TaxID=1874361 RepID=UPI002584106B|nr:hypothetical protein [Idiomarina sp.]
MIDMQTVLIIFTNVVTGAAIIATMRSDINHLKKSDEKQEKRIGNIEQLVASHETRLTVQEQRGQ